MHYLYEILFGCLEVMAGRRRQVGIRGVVVASGVVTIYECNASLLLTFVSESRLDRSFLVVLGQVLQTGGALLLTHFDDVVCNDHNFGLSCSFLL